MKASITVLSITLSLVAISALNTNMQSPAIGAPVVGGACNLKDTSLKSTKDGQIVACIDPTIQWRILPDTPVRKTRPV